MRYRTLGRTGITVSELCLGTMMFGDWGNRDETECRRMVDTALGAGINFIDTADEYALGGSEEIVGRTLRGRRDDVVLATKFHHQMRDGPQPPGQLAPLDHQGGGGESPAAGDRLHRPLPGPPPGPARPTSTRPSARCRISSTRARSGRSARRPFPPRPSSRPNGSAERRGRERFATEQVSYSIFARHAEAAVLPVAERYGLGVLVWSPLNGGWLSGKYRRGAAPARGFARHAPPGPLRSARRGHRRAQARSGRGARPSSPRSRGLTLLQLALGVRDLPPARHLGDHRTPHPRATRGPAHRGGRAARRRGCSTASTSWWRPAPTSIRRTLAGRHPRSPTPPVGGVDAGRPQSEPTSTRASQRIGSPRCAISTSSSVTQAGQKNSRQTKRSPPIRFGSTHGPALLHRPLAHQHVQLVVLRGGAESRARSGSGSWRRRRSRRSCRTR